MRRPDIDINGRPILAGARTNPMTRRLHNVKVVQARVGCTLEVIRRAIRDANDGIMYSREGGAE